MSDVVAVTTQTGATTFGSDEAGFQGLWDSGAFDPNGVLPKEGNEGTLQAAQDSAAAAQTGAQDDGAQSQGQEQPDVQEGVQEGQQEAPTYESLDALLTSLKVDPTSAMKLNVTTKIDGVETQVPLEQVLKSYQLEGHVNNKSIELSNQKTQFETEQANWRTGVQQALQQHQQMGSLAMQMLNHDFNRIDWNGLRTNNPAEYAALQAEFGQRQQQIQGFLQNVQQQQQFEAQQQQQLVQQAIAQEQQRMLVAHPEWRDPQVFAKNQQEMANYARSVGFKDAELSQIHDHRYMTILHDAAQFRALQAASPAALKQVRQAPKMVAPGSRTDTNPAAARQQAAIDRFNRNPRDEDAQAAVFSLLTD